MLNVSSIHSNFTKRLSGCCFQVLGEYSQLAILPDLLQICRCLLDCYHRPDTTTKLHILSAFTKLMLIHQNMCCQGWQRVTRIACRLIKQVSSYV